MTCNSHSSAITDHMNQSGHRMKWDHFDILAIAQSRVHGEIKETLLTRDLKSALNENIGREKLLLYSPFIFFTIRFKSFNFTVIIAFLIWY